MKIPVSTYRIQFNREFRFADALGIIEYLSDLGISDIYASPVFKAVSGSMHGYDIVDHNAFNPEIGTEPEFRELNMAGKNSGIGWIQDIVPNHMAFHYENSMLCDLLEHGSFSEFIDFFDIEWNHTHESLRGRLLAPFLGRFYSESLERGEINIVYEENGLYVRYFDNKYPLNLISYPMLFKGNDLTSRENNVTGNISMVKLDGVLHQFFTLAESRETDFSYDRTAHAKRMLWELYSADNGIREYMNGRLSLYNSTGGVENVEMLDAILEKQMYRLSFWKVAEEELNYRRFFNINGLISLKIEDERVFNHVHKFLKDLIADGSITGLRVDHVDGLYNPAQYLERVENISGDLYVVVEKIIASGEVMPSEWSVQGTTGYDFMNHLNGIYCKSENADDLSRIYSGFTGLDFNYDELAAEKKRLIIEKNMTGDVDNLAALIKQISGNDIFGRDITMHALRNALVEIIAYFPVYRTYINSEKISNADEGYLKIAFEKARRFAPEFSFEYDFLEKCLTLQYIERMDEEKTSKLIHFIMRFQQYTGPFMAKGIEDTVLYIANRLISLNEVGGNPGVFGIPLKRFHNFISERAGLHKYSMNASSTHDSKRGEDVRARINVISEIPQVWKKAVKEWSRINHKRKKGEAEYSFPDRNDEYFLYQTLVGTFPFEINDYDDYVRRIRDYMIKSVREGRVHTAWIKPDAEYENIILRFIDRVLLPVDGNLFLEQFIPFQKEISFYGILNSLSQVIVKTASPGVPDFYQGTELWSLSMVDPDNRNKVDFIRRKKYMENIKSLENNDIHQLLKELWESRDDGRIKLFLIRRLLHLRLRMRELFSEGEYVQLETWGTYKNSVIAFMRILGSETAVAVAPRFLTGIVGEGEMPAGDVWQDTRILLSNGRNYILKDAITGSRFNFSGSIMLRDLLTQFPGALLHGIME